MKIFRLASAVGLLLACERAAPEVSYHSVRDSSGIEIVENQNNPVNLALGSRVLRVGSVDGPGSLYRVTHAFLTSDGGVGVVEASTGLIKFFDPAGTLIRSVGGAGRGPGEFTGLWWASLGPADTLIAFDIAGSTSVSLFDPAGSFARSFLLPRIGLGEPITIGSWPSGALLILMQSASTRLELGQAYEWSLYTVDMTASIAADLGRWEIGLYNGAFEVFAHRAAFAVLGDQLLYTPGDRYEVRHHDEMGSLKRITRIQRPRAPVTQEHIDVYWAELRARMAGRANQEAMLRRLGEPAVADSMPAYASLLTSEGHGFWARRGASPEDSVEVWDVFDEHGVYLGAAALPSGFHARDVSARRVAGTTSDANDVEYVEAYEWTWPQGIGGATGGVHSR